MREFPIMLASNYASTHFNAADLVDQFNGIKEGRLFNNNVGAVQALNLRNLFQAGFQSQKEQQMASARIVKVYIADPNENLPLNKRVLHTGEEQLTDLTDQELFFEVPIAELLAKHNELRKTIIDKLQAEKFGRDIYLEPARIRDLKMVVVSVAAF